MWVKIETDKYYNLLLKINNIGINVYDVKTFNNYILIKINNGDYKKLRKYLISYKTSIYSLTGIDKIKQIIKKYVVFCTSIIVGIFILIIANNMIFKVDIKSNNENIKNLLKSELKKYGLSSMRIKKSHSKIEEIVDDILENNKDKIKWLEIKYDGLIMIVNVTETIDEQITENYNNCNIIASKDSKILTLNIYKGVALKEINYYVNKGEVILSGNIMHNEEVKNTVCSSGEIYGEIWYKVKVEIPLKKTMKEYTGKNRYNMSLKINDDTYKIFKDRIEIYDEEISNLYKLNDFEINFIKSKEYIKKTIKLSEEEAYNNGLKKAEEKIKLMLDEEEEILLKKVLKKEVNDSTIYLEIFIVTKENIGKLQIVREEIENDITTNP